MTDQPQDKRADRPTKRPSTKAEPSEKTAFVVSPIGKAGTPEHTRALLVLNYIVKKAFPAPAWNVVRADDESSPDSITTQVIDRIVNSDLIIADLTGHNPNVFYELAVAHGYQRPVIHMITDGETMPFDITDQRAITYDLANPASVDKAITKLISSQRWIEENPETLRTPLSTHGLFTAISSAPPGAESNEVIASALNEIVYRMGRLERANQPRGYAPPPSRTRRPLTEEERMGYVERLAGIEEELAMMEIADLNDEDLVARRRRLIHERERMVERLK